MLVTPPSIYKGSQSPQIYPQATTQVQSGDGSQSAQLEPSSPVVATRGYNVSQPGKPSHLNMVSDVILASGCASPCTMGIDAALLIGHASARD